MSNVTLDEAKAFLVSAKKGARADWLEIAQRSWNEIKRRAPDGKLRSFDINRKRGKYPLWYNIYKIRQSIVYSRLGIPIVSDTSEVGNDSIGASAAFFKERLANNLAKEDDPKDTMFACRNDLLVTDFTILRGYYEKEDVKEKVKEYLTSKQGLSGEVLWYDANGKLYKGDDFEQDDEGMFTYLPRSVDVTNEKVCIEHILYKHIYIDPDIKRWKRCRRLAFELYYSVPEFKELFGTAAFNGLALAERNKGNVDFEKTQNIKVYEYWDDYTKETKWFHESSENFLEPQLDYFSDAEETEEDGDTRNGLLNLYKFWPCAKPRVRNASTDGFWPTPEYYQFMDILLDIDNIFTRCMAIARIIRPKLFYDEDIDGITEGIGLVSDTEVVGIPNLTKVLANAGSNLNNVAQYLDITTLINALDSAYKALEQRLETIFKMTGTNDMLQGLSADNSGKTLGERQKEEKYSLSLIEELQVMMAELDRDTHELRCEIALKNFKDESLVKYMMPETAPENHQRNFTAALTMLKENNQRFRVDLETDSTIAINEKYDKAMRQELVSAMTESLSQVSGMVESSPGLVQLSLEAMKFYIQGFRGSKIFQEEISQSIDNVIKQTQEAAQNKPPPFDKDQAEHAFDMAKLQQDGQIEQEKIQSDQLIESAKLAQNERLAGIEAQTEQIKLQQEGAIASLANQLETFKAQVVLSKNQGELQFEYEKIKAEMESEAGTLQLKRDELISTVTQFVDKLDVEKFTAQINNQATMFEMQLAQQEQELEKQKVMLDEREKYATEARLQSEYQLAKADVMVKTLVDLHHANLATHELRHKMSEPVVNPVTAKAKKIKRKIKVQRDSEGNLLSLEAEDIGE